MNHPIKDGGTAFPYGFTVHSQSGMTLRDWFAGKALAGIMADQTVRLDSKDGIGTKAIAEQSYWLADAMLKAKGAAQ